MHCLGRLSIRLFVVLAILSILSLSIHDTATAQIVPGSGWSEPLNLSNTTGASEDGYITADNYGNVHVFWSEDTTGTPIIVGNPPLTPPNAILYRSLRNGVWSEAVDLAFSHGGDYTRFPNALVDPNGILHLIWFQDNGLYYRHVPVVDAGRIQAWSPIKHLITGTIKEMRLVQVGERILCVYLSNSKSIFAFYLSDDLSEEPYVVWTAPFGYNPEFLDATSDGKGRIHIVWEVAKTPSTSGLEVRYTNSEDGGVTWSRSRLVVQGVPDTDTSVYFGVPWVAAHGDDEIHLEWAQGSQTYRWHEFSTDGGQTWSQPVKLWSNLFSQTNSRAVGIDGDNNLYWADVLRYPNGIYLMQWNGKDWLRPDMAYATNPDKTSPKEDRYHTESLRMAITEGNQMHLLFLEKDIYEIFYMHKTLYAREIPPLPMPTQVSTIEPDSTATPTAATTVTPATQSKTTKNIPTPLPTSRLRSLLSGQGTPLYLGVVPVILILAALFINKYWRRR